jgi:hypothetical protein
MATARDKVIQSLQETRDAEYDFTGLVAASIAVTQDGDYRRRLESQRRRARQREYKLSERLVELGARRNLGDLGADAARVVGTETLALATAPLQLFRGSGSEERLLKSARDMCASAAVLAAHYRSTEQIAHAGRDEVTAKLAVDMRSESEDVLSACFNALDPLADAVITGEVGGWRTNQGGRSGMAQMLRAPQLREGLYRLREEAADALRSARRGALRLEVEGIVLDYDSLSAEEISKRLSQLSQADLAIVEAYERTTYHRQQVLETLRDLRGREPWPGYDEMTADEVRARLSGAEDHDWIRSVLDYERQHRNRPGVLNAPGAQRVQSG